jgi:predicted DCC family thiol-disulfide oxidoreductase YuxK
MKIVFFDGECNLCNGFINWLLRVDKAGKMKIASLQGESAKRLVTTGPGPGLESVVYLRDGKMLERSSAVLMILFDLGGAWKFLSALMILPKSLRDAVYKLVAMNRSRLFGTRESCRLPTPEERERFLP